MPNNMEIKNMTTTFESANVGDKVYSPAFGWGEIRYIYTSKKYPLSIKFYDDPDEEYEFTFEGYYFKDVPRQSLFWDAVTIEAPTKPVKLTATKIVNGVEVPDISFKPVSGEHCYLPVPTHPVFHIHYCADKADDHLNAFGLCYPLTEEGKQAAILHAKAMLGIS
jgi:hypothetical protein